MALSDILTVSPLNTLIVGPGLVSFQPGCTPTASPFSQILTSLLEAERDEAGLGLKSRVRLAVVTTEARIENIRRLARRQVSEGGRPEFIYFTGANCR